MKKILCLLSFFAMSTSLIAQDVRYTIPPGNSGNSDLMTNPDITNAGDICRIERGTEVTVIEQPTQETALTFAKIEVKEGNCKDKIGWIATEHLSMTN